MFDWMITWMFQPNTYNDMIVYGVIFILLLLLGMIFISDDK